MFELTLIGAGAGSLLGQLEAARIRFVAAPARLDMPLQAGETITILNEATGETPWGALAQALLQWRTLIPARKIIIHRADNTFVYAEKRLTTNYLEAILPGCRGVIVAGAEAP